MKIPTKTRACVHAMARTQDGFTLVELVVAILFLATVLALAVPRLWNHGSEERAARQQTIYGSVRTAAQITRAAAQVRNQTGASGTVTVDGTTIGTVYGYPAATATGIVAATGLDIVNDQINLSEGGANAGDRIVIALNGAPANCSIVYVAPVAADAQPTVDLVNSDGKGKAGC